MYRPKTLVFLATLVFAFTFQINPALSQTDSSVNNTEGEPELTTSVDKETTVQPFNIEVEIGTQSPWDKSVPIIVKVRPNQDTTRTNITWDTPVGVELTDKNEYTYLALPKGQVQVYEVRVKPIVSGTYTIASTATDWGYGANFASTDSITITFNENHVVTPQSTGYSGSVIIRYVVITLSTALIGFLLFLLGKFGLGKLKVWLKPPEL
jgi:hypothetical protein